MSIMDAGSFSGAFINWLRSPRNPDFRPQIPVNEFRRQSGFLARKKATCQFRVQQGLYGALMPVRSRIRRAASRAGRGASSFGFFFFMRGSVIRCRGAGSLGGRRNFLEKGHPTFILPPPNLSLFSSEIFVNGADGRAGLCEGVNTLRHFPSLRASERNPSDCFLSTGQLWQ